ncbi:MAG: nucleoside-diphosphate kinase [Candidatus Diapherotrites archaeon]|uniref:Nucleoside diphosphate kinase n=1 Tax=Candidatus Iainarchaeum sp. TaxID=3101447 RepID=A0A938YXJ8_9ARCH|nr:nucleoside-diphosphate kinase [Candidatus Diapherotrites archaeon]
MERTLVIVKPDAVNRDLVGEIVHRFERKGLKIAAMKMQVLKPYALKEHYAQHKDKGFYEELIKYMSSIPCILMALEGKDCVNVVRKMVGSTLGREAEPGTIRGDYSVSNQANLVHASDSSEKAEEEINRFFGKEELHQYNKMNFDWIYSSDEKCIERKKK